MFVDLLPSSAAVYDSYGDPPGLVLHADEEALVARAVDSRRREFTTGRHCARMALAQLGIQPTSVGRDHAGGPSWPAGIVGSITHCAGYRAAVVAKRVDLVSVGIDAEPAEVLPADVVDMVATPSEREQLEGYDEPWDRVLFSAKESIFKAWWPLTRLFLDFHEAEVVLFPRSGTFEARIIASSETFPRVISGRLAVRNGLIATAVSIPAQPSSYS